MEEEENIKSVQIKQEYLIYGLAAALIVIVILIGSLLYIISSQNAVNTPGQDVNQQLPPGHPQIREGAVPGPLEPGQVQQYEQNSQPSATGAAGGSPHQSTESAGEEKQ